MTKCKYIYIAVFFIYIQLVLVGCNSNTQVNNNVDDTQLIKEDDSEVEKDMIYSIDSISFLEKNLIIETDRYIYYGFNIEMFTNDNEEIMRLQITEYRTVESLDVPIMFKILTEDEVIEFNGLTYIDVTGCPTAEYVGGRFGSIKAYYIKGNIYIKDKNSLDELFEKLNIDCDIKYIDKEG